jgi:uncharacterized membrane protein
MLPFVRAFTSIVAGLVRVPAGKFGILSLIGTVLYAAALSSLGYALGSTWQSVSHGLAVVGYILFALVVLAIVGFIAYRWRAVRREDQYKRASAAATPAEPAASGPGPGPGQPSGSGQPSGPGPAQPSGSGQPSGLGPGQPAGPGPAQPAAPGAGQPGASAPADRPRPHSHRAG